MPKITFESLYFANNSWIPDTQLTLIIGDCVYKMSAGTAIDVYGDYAVDWFHDTDVELY